MAGARVRLRRFIHLSWPAPGSGSADPSTSLVPAVHVLLLP